MADYRRHLDEEPRRHERDWSDRASDEVRSWFGDEKARQRRGHDDREDRASRWEGPREDRDFGGYAASTGSYRTDDRGYHDRYRAERAREDGPSNGRSRFANGHDAADEYYRAAREQRDDYTRWEARARAPSSKTAGATESLRRHGRGASAAATGGTTSPRRPTPAAARRTISAPTSACAKKFVTA